MKKVIAISAGKGGVGKSTICVQLALALTRLKQRVAIMDADLYGPSLRQLLPETQSPVPLKDRFMPAYTDTIAWMSLSFFRDEAAMRAPMANQWIQQLLHKVDWGDPDILLIDFPPGTGDIPISICQAVKLHSAALVTMPGALSCLDVRKAAATFQKLHVPLAGVIENMSYLEGTPSFSPFGQGGGRKLAEELSVPFLGAVPLDPLLNTANDQGKAKDYYHSVFDAIAGKLVDTASQPISFDANTLHWKAAKLQEKCPCAACRTQGHAEREVEIQKIERIGQYGYRFHFSSGCCNGIYEESYLKTLRDTCVAP